MARALLWENMPTSLLSCLPAVHSAMLGGLHSTRLGGSLSETLPRASLPPPFPSWHGAPCRGAQRTEERQALAAPDPTLARTAWRQVPELPNDKPNKPDRKLAPTTSMGLLTPWLIQRDDINLIKKMSSGGFGQVGAPGALRWACCAVLCCAVLGEEAGLCRHAVRLQRAGLRQALGVVAFKAESVPCTCCSCCNYTRAPAQYAKWHCDHTPPPRTGAHGPGGRHEGSFMLYLVKFSQVQPQPRPGRRSTLPSGT